MLEFICCEWIVGERLVRILKGMMEVQRKMGMVVDGQVGILYWGWQEVIGFVCDWDVKLCDQFQKQKLFCEVGICLKLFIQNKEGFFKI